MMARCVMMCVIEANFTNVHDPGQKKWYLELKNLKFQGFFQKKCLKLQFFMLQETVSAGNMSTERIF